MTFVKWLAEKIGWTLGQSGSYSSISTVDTYFYMAALIFVCVFGLIMFSEVMCLIKSLVRRR